MLYRIALIASIAPTLALPTVGMSSFPWAEVHCGCQVYFNGAEPTHTQTCVTIEAGKTVCRPTSGSNSDPCPSDHIYCPFAPSAPPSPPLPSPPPPISPPLSASMDGSKMEWTNWARNRKSEDVLTMEALSEAQLLVDLQHSVDNHLQAKAVGSGFSTSAASQPVSRGVQIKTPATVMTHRDSLRKDVDSSHLVRVGAGIVLRDLAEELAKRDLALINMGGFAGQTLGGVISTSTHGTGLNQPPFPDMVRSVEVAIINDKGKAELHTFEPANGISDEARFEGQLTQDDDAFYSVVASMGTMGVVYAYTIEVIDLYWVEERKEYFEWPRDYERIYNRAKAGEDLSITLHPYATLENGNHMAFATTFQRVNRSYVDSIDPNLWANPPPPQTNSPLLQTVADLVNDPALNLEHELVGSIMSATPWIWRGILNDEFEAAKDFKPFLSVYYNTYMRPTADHFPATFSETAVPMDKLFDFTNAALKVVEEYKLPDVYFTGLGQTISGLIEGFTPFVPDGILTWTFNLLTLGWFGVIDGITSTVAAPSPTKFEFMLPFSLRFVGKSDHYLSMQYGRNTGHFESFMVNGMHNRDFALQTLERELNINQYENFEGRPHWGMMFWDFPGGPNGWAEKLYPKGSKWKALQKKLNEKGVFTGPMTHALNLDDDSKAKCASTMNCSPTATDGNRNEGKSCGRQPAPAWCDGFCCDMAKPTTFWPFGKGGGTCVNPECWWTTPERINAEASW